MGRKRKGNYGFMSEAMLRNGILKKRQRSQATNEHLQRKSETTSIDSGLSHSMESGTSGIRFSGPSSGPIGSQQVPRGNSATQSTQPSNVPHSNTRASNEVIRRRDPQAQSIPKDKEVKDKLRHFEEKGLCAHITKDTFLVQSMRSDGRLLHRYHHVRHLEESSTYQCHCDQYRHFGTCFHIVVIEENINGVQGTHPLSKEGRQVVRVGMREVWSVEWSRQRRACVIREKGEFRCISEKGPCHHASIVQNYEDLMNLAVENEGYRPDLQNPPSLAEREKVPQTTFNNFSSETSIPEVVIETRFADFGKIVPVDVDPPFPDSINDHIDGRDFSSTIRQATFKSLKNKYEVPDSESDLEGEDFLEDIGESHSPAPFCEDLYAIEGPVSFVTYYPTWITAEYRGPPEVSSCLFCKERLKSGTMSDIVVHSEMGVYLKSLSLIICLRCRYGVTKDGTIWVVDGKFGYETDLFWALLEVLMHNAATITGFCETLNKAIERRTKSPTEPVTIKVFTQAFCSFLKFHPLPTTFTCRACSSRPKVLIADGKQIGFQKSRLLGPDTRDVVPWEHYGDDPMDLEEHRPTGLWKTIRSKGPDEINGSCRKNFKPKKRLTAGIMAFWCPHGHCCGFHIIGRSEGLRDVYAAVRSHWHQAPEVIIYDLSCALEKYCLTRDPEWFSETLFIVDDFHWKGHVCEEKYRLRAFTHSRPELATVRTTLAEVGNCTLDRIAKTVRYMSHERAFLLLRAFLGLRNYEIIRKAEKSRKVISKVIEEFKSGK